MKAGQTNLDVGTKIRITHINDNDPEEKQGLEGATGTITHPFPGFMSPNIPAKQYIAGVYLDNDTNPFPTPWTPHVNLVRGDEFEVVDS